MNGGMIAVNQRMFAVNFESIKLFEVLYFFGCSTFEDVILSECYTFLDVILFGVIIFEIL